MTDTNGNGAQGAPGGAPALNSLAQYLKDFSFENPNAPRGAPRSRWGGRGGQIAGRAPPPAPANPASHCTSTPTSPPRQPEAHHAAVDERAQ